MLKEPLTKIMHQIDSSNILCETIISLIRDMSFTSTMHVTDETFAQ